MKEQLIVAEKFYSIQGEGSTAGVPAVFLRLSACNLLCKSEHWICDSIASWQPKGTKTKFKDVLPQEYVEQLKVGYRNCHLVITGGEPLLQQRQIVAYLNWFEEEYKFKPTIEIETNGTIVPSIELQKKVLFWNCSPKLSNSGELEQKRINLDAIEAINKPLRGNIMFKFVITRYDDIVELFETYAEHIDNRYIWLMPGGESKEELDEVRPLVADFCKTYHFRYSDRLQVAIWDKALGV